MKQLRLIVLVVLTVLIVVLALQNTETVDTRLLFATVSMPRAVLIFTSAAIGFLLGVLASVYWARKGEKAATPRERRPPPEQPST